MEPLNEKLIQLTGRLAELLAEHKFSIVTAESCTGGWLAHVLTVLPSCSTWFERGFVTYSDNAKIELLNVAPDLLQQQGPVSKEVAVAMAKGALAHSKAQISLAITGLAGPDKDDKSLVPIGTCWFAWSINGQQVNSHCEQFNGDRLNVNYCAVAFALSKLISILKNFNK